MKGTRGRDFRSLSVKDLIEARDAYHIHLAHLEHVFATAIGRYLIRDEDPNAQDRTSEVPRGALGARTLYNARPRDWSWPCVLVFVDQWLSREQIAANPALSEELVPPFLFLPDGRVVPTCVVLVDADVGVPAAGPAPVFKSDIIGGGYPVAVDVQGKTHVGSVGCLVTDGDSVYALTNRHVCGEQGRPVYADFKNRERVAGTSHGLQVGKIPFAQAYPGWPGARVLANLDAGLVRVTDVRDWTAQVYGIGEIGSLWDLNVDTFTLDLINCPVTAFGAASGKMTGSILGLFYRYKSVGGYDYVTEFVIGPRERDTPVNNIPGNSGTLWFEDAQDVPKNANGARKLRPFGVEWGGQVLLAPGSQTPAQLVLVSCLATICRQLDVELIASWNTGHREYWGEWGHVKIGAYACELVSRQTDSLVQLSELMRANADNIGMSDAILREGLGNPSDHFSPLADVADLVWRDTRPDDESNHFADMDKPGHGEFAGKTLLDVCRDRKKVHPDVWNEYYASIGEGRRGALPFRLWQIYDDMVDFARRGDFTSFVCAAGLAAHYNGDACQPLHISQYHHGKDPKDAAQKRVHSVYETTMIGTFGSQLVDLIRDAQVPAVPPIAGTGPGGAVTGQDVAVAIVALMRRTVEDLSPLTIVDEFNKDKGSHRTQQMWDKLKVPTARRMKDGALTLARVWEAAWAEGRKGATVPVERVTFTHQALEDLYNDDGFLRSYKLQMLTTDPSGLLLVPI